MNRHQRERLTCLIFGLVVVALGIAGMCATGYAAAISYNIGDYDIAALMAAGFAACAFITYNGGALAATR